MNIRRVGDATYWTGKLKGLAYTPGAKDLLTRNKIVVKARRKLRCFGGEGIRWRERVRCKGGWRANKLKLRWWRVWGQTCLMQTEECDTCWIGLNEIIKSVRGQSASLLISSPTIHRRAQRSNFPHEFISFATDLSLIDAAKSSFLSAQWRCMWQWKYSSAYS
jgi:hypothetical protein